MNKYLVLFSFVVCNILCVRNGMVLRIISVLGNFEYANCASKRCEKVHFMFGGEDFRADKRLAGICVT